MPGRIVCVDPTEVSALPGGTCSAGIHPWRTDRATPEALRQLDEWARLPEVVAIGETGLDPLRGPSLDIQRKILEYHAALAGITSKPLILHIVRRWDDIIALKRRLNPQVEWIVHGFRGGPQLARQLVGEGFSLSLGERFNPGVPGAVSSDRIYAETDCSDVSISEIRRRIDLCRGGLADSCQQSAH